MLMGCSPVGQGRRVTGRPCLISRCTCGSLTVLSHLSGMCLQNKRLVPKTQLPVKFHGRGIAWSNRNSNPESPMGPCPFQERCHELVADAFPPVFRLYEHALQFRPGVAATLAQGPQKVTGDHVVCRGYKSYAGVVCDAGPDVVGELLGVRALEVHTRIEALTKLELAERVMETLTGLSEANLKNPHDQWAQG